MAAALISVPDDKCDLATIEWQGPFEGWSRGFLKKNFWRVEPLMDYADAMQECALVFVRLKKHYAETVNNPRHLMGLFKSSVSNYWNTLCHEASGKRDHDTSCTLETAIEGSDLGDLEALIDVLRRDDVCQELGISSHRSKETTQRKRIVLPIRALTYKETTQRKRIVLPIRALTYKETTQRKRIVLPIRVLTHRQPIVLHLRALTPRSLPYLKSVSETCISNQTQAHRALGKQETIMDERQEIENQEPTEAEAIAAEGNGTDPESVYRELSRVFRFDSDDSTPDGAPSPDELIEAMAKMDDETWQALSAPAQLWYNSLSQAINDGKKLPPCPGYDGDAAVTVLGNAEEHLTGPSKKNKRARKVKAAAPNPEKAVKAAKAPKAKKLQKRGLPFYEADSDPMYDYIITVADQGPKEIAEALNQRGVVIKATSLSGIVLSVRRTMKALERGGLLQKASAAQTA